MTVVNTETGVIADLPTMDEAQRLTTEARNEFGSASAHNARGWEIVGEAITSGAYLTMGYASPGAYISGEFDGVLSGLNVTERRVAARQMQVLGVSNRDAAKVLGVSNFTVSKDRNSGGSDLPPAQTPEPAEGGEAEAGSGQTSPDVEDGGASLPASDDAPADDQSEGGAATPSPSRPPITGHDGKVYKFEKPKKKAKPRQAKRQDAELILNSVQSLLNRAALEADKLTPAQIARVKPKADLWTVGLGNSMETLARLLTSLTEEK